MLSDRDVASMRDDYVFLFYGHAELNSEAWEIGALDMRRRYESKITSGELRVVKKATDIGEGTWFKCSNCNCEEAEGPDEGEFCRCGAQIVKE